MQGYQPTSQCSKCNGKCCQFYAGTACPDDFGITTSEDAVETIYFLLKSKGWAVDCWMGDPNIYFIRPAHKDAIGTPLDESWGGGCVFFTDGKGCDLSFDKRPVQCRMLKAKENEEDHCTLEKGYSKYECAIMWDKFQKEILEAVRKVEEE